MDWLRALPSEDEIIILPCGLKGGCCVDACRNQEILLDYKENYHNKNNKLEMCYSRLKKSLQNKE